MGKVVTIYLSDEETRDLKDFCDTNRCTQYGALKTAVKQLLYTSMQSLDADTIIEEQETETQIDDTEATRIQEEIDLATKIRSARACSFVLFGDLMYF
jgi:hypothetical protein